MSFSGLIYWALIFFGPLILLTIAFLAILATKDSGIIGKALEGNEMPLRLLVLNFFLFIACLFSQAVTPGAAAASTGVEESTSTVSPRLLLKPGQPLVAGMQAEDIVATYDVPLAREQVAAYPDSPEASFVLAVALTRTSMVEEALHEVRRARKLAENKGGPSYFDHMISEYEDMLKSYPNDNRVRYGLAWAYYMKAYVLTHYAKSVVSGKPVVGKSGINDPQSGITASGQNWHNVWVKSLSVPANNAKAEVNSNGTYKSISFRQDLPPEIVPQVRNYYESALGNLDDLLVREPNDMWARAYRAFLYADYTGDLSQSMDAWKTCLTMAPNNPAAYFFLGESYLQKGNLKECIHNISKAVALRGLPN